MVTAAPSPYQQRFLQDEVPQDKQAVRPGSDSEPVTHVRPAHPSTTTLLFTTCLPHFTSFPWSICSHAEQLGDSPVDR